MSEAGLLSPVWAATPVAAAVSDRAWLQAMLDAEAALARAQARLGMVPGAAAEAITSAAKVDRFDIDELAGRARAAANPVVALVVDLTAAVDPAAADYVHRGATSQDILDTAAMLVATRALRLITADLDRTAAALARLAAEHRDTLMPGRTLTQHAVPTTFGLKAAGWLHAVLAATERIRRLDLPVQLGGAAGTLAGYLEYARLGPGAGPAGSSSAGVDELLTAFAAELDLAEPLLPWHTIRTPVLDLAAALAQVTGAVGKLAVDVQLLSRTEVAEVAEPAAAGRGGSSAMPHKRNPVLATLIRSAALQVPPLAAGLAQSMLAEDERPAGVWHAEWQPLRECLRLAGGATHTAAELAEGLVVFPERMRANLDLTGSLVVSERLAAVLGATLGRQAAKDVVTRASATAASDERPLAEVLATAPELAGRFSQQHFEELLDPADYTGAAGLLVDRVLRRYRQPEVPR